MPGGTAVAEPKATSTRLTNLDHLDFLGDTVAPPKQAGHTTYQLARHPKLGVLWTYADRQSDGSYKRVGGGTYDATKDTYLQGAFNADDLARAAVVYLRDWKQTRHASSRSRAFEMLRGLTYLQTTSGRDAGNVVLWMQPDGTLNRSAEPAELPDPSDSDASYWLARTIWALGEGYAAFEKADPAFARFLARRLDLAVRAVDRQVLDAYGEYENVDGRRTPAWLIADGADASAEAVLGLAAYVRAGGTSRAKRTMVRLSNGIAQLAGGDARSWPFGGILPWAQSRSDWHAWSSQMAGALARAADVTGNDSWRRVAARDAFTFDPWMLTSGGIDNGRLPSRVDATQIAYGADSRVQNLLATGGGGSTMAGIVAAWFFGANAAKAPTYDPATGVTFDGVAADGTINQNSGAESTIHGLLTMLALDAHPAVKRIAMTASVRAVEGVQYVQAEDGRLAPGATAVVPTATWTGESQYAGTGYAALGNGGSVTIDLAAHPDSLVMPVLDLEPGQLRRHLVHVRQPHARDGALRRRRCPRGLAGSGSAASRDPRCPAAASGDHGHCDHEGHRWRHCSARRTDDPAAALADGPRWRRARHRPAAQRLEVRITHHGDSAGHGHRPRLVVRRGRASAPTLHQHLLRRTRDRRSRRRHARPPLTSQERDP